MIGDTMDLPETRHPPDQRPIAVEDAEILAEIGRGDLSRFDTLVDRYKCRLLSYIGHRVADRHHAVNARIVSQSGLRRYANSLSMSQFGHL